MRTGLSQGLSPRFEALPKFGKSPNSPGGVRAKALTPHPQRGNILSPSDSLVDFCYRLEF